MIQLGEIVVCHVVPFVVVVMFGKVGVRESGSVGVGRIVSVRVVEWRLG